MVEFADVTFDDRARASFDLLQSIGAELACIPVDQHKFCVAAWARSRLELQQVQVKLLARLSVVAGGAYVPPGDEQYTQLKQVKQLTPSRIRRDERGGWLLPFRHLVCQDEAFN